MTMGAVVMASSRSRPHTRFDDNSTPSATPSTVATMVATTATSNDRMSGAQSTSVDSGGDLAGEQETEALHDRAARRRAHERGEGAPRLLPLRLFAAHHHRLIDRLMQPFFEQQVVAVGDHRQRQRHHRGLD